MPYCSLLRFAVRLGPTLAAVLVLVGFAGVEDAFAQSSGGGVSGSGGAPLPLLGGTILGQICAAGGGYALWRRYRRGKAGR